MNPPKNMSNLSKMSCEKELCPHQPFRWTITGPSGFGETQPLLGMKLFTNNEFENIFL